MEDYVTYLRMERRFELAMQTLYSLTRDESIEDEFLAMVEEFYNHNHDENGKFTGGKGGGGVSGKSIGIMKNGGNKDFYNMYPKNYERKISPFLTGKKLPSSVKGNATLLKKRSTYKDRKAVSKEAGGFFGNKANRQQVAATKKAHQILRKEGGTYKEVTSRLGLIKITKLNETDLKNIPDKQLSSLHKLAKNNLQGAAVLSRIVLPSLDVTLGLRSYGKWRFNRLPPQIKRIETELSRRKVKFELIDVIELSIDLDLDSNLTFDMAEAIPSEDSEAPLTTEEKATALYYLKELLADVDEDEDAPPDLKKELEDALNDFSVQESIVFNYINLFDMMEFENLMDTEEFGTLPPALKAQLVKKLEAQLAKEKDVKKKAVIQAKIDSYS